MGGKYLVWEGKENFRGFRDFCGIDLAHENRIIKLSFQINIKTHSELYCPNFGRGRYSNLKKMYTRFFRNQIVFEILNFIKANFDWWKALENDNYFLMQIIS